MIDREEVIKGLKCCVKWMKECDVNACKSCPYHSCSDCIATINIEAIALLNEQEPMQVKMDMYGNAYCPWCSTDGTIEMGAQKLHLGTQFCPYCGKAVKWE